MKKVKLNVTNGGNALPIGNNIFYMIGRKHKAGGIDIGRGKNGIEVEDGEIVKYDKGELKILSDKNMLGVMSPADYAIRTGNFDRAFNIQEGIKNRIGIDNNDNNNEFGIGGALLKVAKALKNKVGNKIGNKVLNSEIGEVVEEASKTSGKRFAGEVGEKAVEQRRLVDKLVKDKTKDMGFFDRHIRVSPLRNVYRDVVNEAYEEAKKNGIPWVAGKGMPLNKYKPRGKFRHAAANMGARIVKYGTGVGTGVGSLNLIDFISKSNNEDELREEYGDGGVVNTKSNKRKYDIEGVVDNTLSVLNKPFKWWDDGEVEKTHGVAGNGVVYKKDNFDKAADYIDRYSIAAPVVGGVTSIATGNGAPLLVSSLASGLGDIYVAGNHFRRGRNVQGAISLGSGLFDIFGGSIMSKGAKVVNKVIGNAVKNKVRNTNNKIIRYIIKNKAIRDHNSGKKIIKSTNDDIE